MLSANAGKFSIPVFSAGRRESEALTFAGIIGGRREVVAGIIFIWRYCDVGVFVGSRACVVNCGGVCLVGFAQKIRRNPKIAPYIPERLKGERGEKVSA